MLDTERIATVFAGFGRIEFLKHRFGKLRSGVFYFGQFQHAGVYRIFPGELGVVHVRRTTLSPPREMVEPVLAPLDVADDPHRPTRGSQRRAERVPSLVPKP